MNKQAVFPRKAIALCAAAALAATCGAVAIALATPGNAEAKTVTLKAKSATKSFSKGATKVKATGLKVKVAKDGSKRAATFKLKLTGSKAKKYNIWYRVYAKGYGWMGWAKNNAKAGSLVKGAYATKIQTALVKKSAKTQKSTDRKAYSAKKGFMAKITGDTSTDATIKKVAKQNGMDLRKCYDWANALEYGSSGVVVTESKTMSAAHQNAIAKFVFKKNLGDCYGVNVAFAKLATYLGYSAQVYVGGVYKADGTVANPEYGWAVVKTGGSWNIYDAYHGGDYYNIGSGSATYAQYVRK